MISPLRGGASHRSSSSEGRWYGERPIHDRDLARMMEDWGVVVDSAAVLRGASRLAAARGTRLHRRPLLSIEAAQVGERC